MKFLPLLPCGIFLIVAAFLAGCSTTVAGPDGGVVSVGTPPGSGVTIDPPGPAGISIGGP